MFSKTRFSGKCSTYIRIILSLHQSFHENFRENWFHGKMHYFSFLVHTMASETYMYSLGNFFQDLWILCSITGKELWKKRMIRYTIFTTTTFYLCHDGWGKIQRPLDDDRKKNPRIKVLDKKWKHLCSYFSIILDRI